jgi:hypothetical protein
MADTAPDRSENILMFPEAREPLGIPLRAQRAQPGLDPKRHSSLVEQAADPRTNPKHATDRFLKTPAVLQNAQAQAKVLDPDTGPGDRPHDTLTLLEQLAHNSISHDRTQHNPVAQSYTTPSAHVAAIGVIEQSNSAEQNAKARLPPRRSAIRKIAWFAIAGCYAALVVGGTGSFLWSRISADHGQWRTEVVGTVTTPSAPTAVASERSAVAPVQARPDILSVETVMAECILAAWINPFAKYFLVAPNAVTGNVRSAPKPVGVDYGWYTMMSSKARLERRGSGC